MSSSNSTKPEKILLLIRSLHIGGAERQVVALARSISDLGTEIHVAVKVRGGPLEADLANIPEVKFHDLTSPSIVGRITYFLKLRTLIKTNKFDAVYGFMPLPNLALLVARTIRNRPLIAWGVRSSDVDPNDYRSRVKWSMRLEKWLSRFADRVITNSQAALEEYRTIGYPFAKLSHIPNAIDVDRFQPNTNARSNVETELGIPAGASLIGIFARIHPMKDHTTFLRAAKTLLETLPEARFICAGEVSAGYSSYNNQIRDFATQLGLDDNVLWLGQRNDPEKLMPACDITTLTSSSGEGFPNSVAESLACGIPCAVADIGDAAVIVNNPEYTVSRGDHEALANAWQTMLIRLDNERSSLSLRLRESIVDRFSPEQIARDTLSQLGEQPN